MNAHLQKALKELETAGSSGMPASDEVMQAENGSEWSGDIEGHGDWTLIKEAENSYRTNTRHHVK